MDQRGGNGYELCYAPVGPTASWNAISKLGGRASEWALTCSPSIDEAFPTWDLLKQQIFWVFAPPNQAYRVRSCFLSARQGKKKLSDYVQELRTLIASMQIDPLPDMVLVTIIK